MYSFLLDSIFETRDDKRFHHGVLIVSVRSKDFENEMFAN